jgi:GNAT superfamily N-acetyltransferase
MSGSETRVLVRRALPDEVATVSSVLGEAARWLEDRGEPLWARDELALSVLTLEIQAGHYYLALTADGEGAGVLRLTFDDPEFWGDTPAVTAAYVHRLAVRRAHAGGGVSSALLTWARGEAERHGCSYLRLDCDAARPKLRHLYERFGFRYHSDRQVGPYLVARYELALRAP